MSRRRGASGTVSVILAALVLAGGGLGLLGADVARLLLARARAEAAADAGALAAAFASYPHPTPLLAPPAMYAAGFAPSNQVDRIVCLPPCAVRGDPGLRTVTVRAEVDVQARLLGVVTVTAEARASFDPCAYYPRLCAAWRAGQRRPA